MNSNSQRGLRSAQTDRRGQSESVVDSSVISSPSLENAKPSGRGRSWLANAEQCCLYLNSHELGMKTDRIRTDIIDTIFVFIFLVEFGFEYG